MRSRLLFIIALLLGLGAPRASASVILSSLVNPTLQTLIDLGSDGVSVGSLQFYDFNFLSSPVASSPIAASIAVDGVTSSGDGLQFVSAWLATEGDSVTDFVDYKVAVTDPTQTIETISLFCDGTAPVPAGGAFVSTSLAARASSGAVAGRILNTYDDGVTKPVDTTFPDYNTDFIDFPAETSLSITQSISVNSGTSGDSGVASASTVEDAFDPVPLPAPGGWGLVSSAIFAGALSRRWRRRVLR
jgi:hypothetical protein